MTYQSTLNIMWCDITSWWCRVFTRHNLIQKMKKREKFIPSVGFMCKWKNESVFCTWHISDIVLEYKWGSAEWSLEATTKKEFSRCLWCRMVVLLKHWDRTHGHKELLYWVCEGWLSIYWRAGRSKEKGGFRRVFIS